MTPLDMVRKLNLTPDAIIRIPGPKADAQDELIRAMTDAGDGARAVVHFERVNGTAHWMNAENISGQTWLFDTVTGQAISLNGPHQRAADALLRAFDAPPDPSVRGFAIKPDDAFLMIFTHRP